MDIIFQKLISARLALGHTIQAACDAMGVHRAAWYAWAKAAEDGGGTFRCHPLTERAVTRYLARASGRDKDGWDVEKIKKLAKELNDEEKAGE